MMLKMHESPDPGRNRPKNPDAHGKMTVKTLPGWWPFRCTKQYMFLKLARTPGTPQFGRKRRPRIPRIWSNGRTTSLVFEAGIGDRLGTLKVSKLPC